MKKLVYLLFGASLFLFGACRSASDPINEVQNSLVSVRFQVDMQSDIVPFHTRSMPGNLPGEPTIGNDGEGEPQEPTACRFIEYLVYNDSKEFVKQSRFENGPQISDSLYPGIYTVYFFAHSTEAVKREGNTLVFPDDVSESFFQFMEIEVESGRDFQENITLKRVVSKVEFVPKDELPADVARFTITASGIYKTFDLFTGRATGKTSPFESTTIFEPEDYLPGKQQVHAFFTFVPESDKPDGAGSIEQITLVAENKTAQVAREKQIGQVPIYPNRITRYKGTLYTLAGDGSFQIDIDQAWGEDIEQDLEEGK